jgi:4-hydroxy-tetrahydrodipicolinate synthase
MPETGIIVKEKLAVGLIPAVPVMFDRAHRFHERAHASYVDYMHTQPIAGVAVWAHTGRGLHLAKDVARRVIEDWREALPHKPLIAGVGADSKTSDPVRATEATLSMAADAAQYGADAVLAYPPSWLRQHEARDRLIIEHHARLAQLGLPIILFYLYEAAGGISYNANVLDELLSLPNVMGIKMGLVTSRPGIQTSF